MSEIKDPLDRVIEILVFIRDNAEEIFVTKHMEYCINQITSGKLFNGMKLNHEQNEL